MGDLGLDPETALKLIQALLRGVAYFFAGFAVLGLAAYAVFLCREIFASHAGGKVGTTKVLGPMGCASVVEQNNKPLPGDTRTLVKEGTIARVEVQLET